MRLCSVVTANLNKAERQALRESLGLLTADVDKLFALLVNVGDFLFQMDCLELLINLSGAKVSTFVK